MTSLWLPSFLVTCHLLCVTIATNTLYIGGLFDFNAKDAERVISTAKVAIQEINNNTGFLTDYQLELLVNNTRDGDFSSASGVNSYLNNGPNKIMLLGPADNDLAKAVAYHAKLLQFSYGTNDLYLSNDRNLYPYFFRTCISMETFDDLRIAFIKYYGWTEVGIVYGDDILDAQLSNQLKVRIESQSKVKVLAEVRLQANDPERAIHTIQDKNIHVIIGLFPMDITARRLFCQAYKRGLYGPHYVWILQNAHNNGWWKPGPGEDIGGCQSIEMTCQIRNYFSVKPAIENFVKEDKLSHSGKNTSQIMNTLRQYSNVTAVDDVMMYVYDAVWAIAHVLNNSKGRIGKALENVTYGDTSATEVFYKETLKLNFESPKLERVRFFQNGNRKFDMSLEQVVVQDENSNPSSVEAGTYSFISDSFVKGKVTWLANTPHKTITETHNTRYIHRALFGALIFLACLGILYALVCFIVVLLYRKQSIIWNSSPIINIIIIFGCILNYITIILYAFDWNTTAITTSFCRARAWTFAIGFTLSVGGLVAKLWIAYCVLSERFVRQWKNILIWMLAIILVLFILDLIIMGCWEGNDPLYAYIETYKKQEEYKCFQPITENTFRVEFYTVEHCTCKSPLLWLLIILIIKFLVAVFGVFLAWQTRKLYIKSLNDTQYCAFCMFVVFFFVIFGVLIALLSTAYPNLFFAIVGLFLFLCTTIILGLLFIHKMARVVCKRRSGGKRILVTGVDSDAQSSSKGKACSCLGCSGACCIGCCGCFPCCNIFLCCRSCCLGSKVHPSEESSDNKTEFYIAGQPQDKEGQIAYLLREIHERDVELARLRPKHTSTSIWTQTYDDDTEDYLTREEGDGSSLESDNSDESFDSNGKKRKRKPSTRFKIYNQGADYSHIQSKVDSGVSKSPVRSPKTQGKHDEKYYLGVWRQNGGRPSNDEIAKLRAQLEKKDKEIEKLRSEREGQTSVIVHQPNSPSRKVTLTNEKTPETKEKHCQTDDIISLVEQSPRDKPNDVVVVMETPVKNEMSPSKKPAKGRKVSKAEPKDNVHVVEVKVKNAKKRSKKDKEKDTKSPDEWLFGKTDDEKAKEEENIPVKKDLNTVVIIEAPSEQEKKDEPKSEEKRDGKTDVIIVRPEETQTTQEPITEEKQNKEDGGVTNVIVVRPEEKMTTEETKTEEIKQDKVDGNITNVIIIRPDEKQENKEEEKKEEKKREERKEEKRKEEEMKEEESKEEEKRKEEERKEEESKEEEKRKEEEKKEEEKRKEEERKEEESKEEEKRKEEERKEEEKRKEEERKEEESKEEEKRKEEERKEEEKRKEEESKEEEKRKEEKKKEEERKKEVERKKEEERNENEKRIEEKKKKEERLEEEKRKEEERIEKEWKEEKRQKDEEKRNEEQKIEERRKEEREREEQRKDEKDKLGKEQKEMEEKQNKDEGKENQPNEEFDDDEVPIRPPQNTPASVDGPHDQDKNKKELNDKDVMTEEKPKEPEKEGDDKNDYNDEESDDDDDKVQDNDRSSSDDDEDDGDKNDSDDKKDKDGAADEKDDNNQEKNKDKSQKSKRKSKKPIGGKLNWNAESKVDTSSGYKKKTRKKIKSYKVDYSHVKSKYSYGVKKKEQDEVKEKEETERKKKPTVKRKRWNPNNPK